jgi:hypothetical protein
MKTACQDNVAVKLGSKGAGKHQIFRLSGPLLWSVYREALTLSSVISLQEQQSKNKRESQTAKDA